MGNLLSGSRAPNLSSIRDTTPEYLAFRKCYENVIGTVKEQPGAICDALFAKGYVPTSVRDFTRNMSILDEVKAQKLVDTMIDRIGKDPNVFHGFVDILKGPSTDDIVTLLQEAYDTERGLVGHLEPEHLASQQAKSSAEYDYREPEQLVSHQLAAKPNVLGTEDNDSSGDESFHSTATELKSFICPFCKECTLERFFSEEGCPHRTRSIEGYSKLFPYMDVKGLEKDDIIDLQQRLISDTREILKKFADFSIYIRDSLERQNSPLEKFKHSILSLRAFREIDNEVKVLDIEHQAKLLGATSVSEVFLILQSNNYISFYNYHLLEHLIKHHGCSDDRRLLEEYLRDLHTFCQRNVFEIPPLVFSSCNVPEKGKLFALKCAKGVETLEGVQTLQNEVAKVFGLRFSALRLCLIKNGCVELHLVVSAAVAERIFPLSHGQHLALREIGVRVLVSPICVINCSDNNLRFFPQQYRSYQIS